MNMKEPKIPESGSQLEKVLVILDEIRKPLMEIGFRLPAVAYSRRKLDRAHNLDSTLSFLELVKGAITSFQKSPVFPGVKSVEDYRIMGIKGTKEQDIYYARKDYLKKLWLNRPDILRKIKKAGVSSSGVPKNSGKS